MLKLVIPDKEYYDEETGRFKTFKGITLQLEHSLVSVSKWESEWKKPFLKEGEKSYEETLDYIRCMTITQNVPPLTYYLLTQKEIDTIEKYIADPMTATTISNLRKDHSRPRTVTAELIYYWMINFGIPFECQKWHLGRLLTLINVCKIEGTSQKKMSQKEQAAYNRSLNAQRRRNIGTKG